MDQLFVIVFLSNLFVGIFLSMIMEESPGKLAAWSGILAILSGFVFDWSALIERLSHCSDSVVIARCAGTVVAYTLIQGFFLWIVCAIGTTIFLKRHFQERHRQIDQNMTQALEEIEMNNVDKLCWARAFEEADGDINKTKARYIKYRSKVGIK